MLKERYECPCCLTAIDLLNSTRPFKPVSASIQALPTVKSGSESNVGTQSLQEVAHDNTLWVCVCGGEFPPSFSGRDSVSTFVFSPRKSPQWRKIHYPMHFYPCSSFQWIQLIECYAEFSLEESLNESCLDTETQK